MKHETKTFRAEVKSGGDLKAGEFVAIVSVFDNVDLGGDRIVKGAFDRTIKEWQAKGDPLPIIWSHEWDNPQAHIGYADPKNIRETDAGLEIKAQLDVDRPFAEQVSHLLKSRRVTQFSFGYFAKDFETVDDAEFGKVRELKDVDIFEAGPTLLGMNPATQLLEAASLLKEKKDGEAMADLLAHQLLEYQALEGIVEEVGQFDQSTGGKGAHYAPAEANPFKADGLMCQNCVFYEGTRACEIVAGDIDPEAICKLWIIPEALLAGPAQAEQMSTDEGETKAIETKAISVPEYVSANAKRGLKYYEDGFGGDGLVDATIRSARQMASGSVSEEKVRKIGPWIARHIVDLDASKNSDPNDPEYPGAGLVAMLLWGAGPDVEGARQTQAWAERESARLDDSAKSADVEVTQDDSEEVVTGDTQGTIDIERLMSLVVRTRNNEE